MLTSQKILNQEYTQLEKERLNKAHKLLLTGTKENPITKHQVAKEVGLKGERVGRDYANAVGVIKPVISNSKESGFRIAKTKEDENDNLIKIFETLSRCEELLYKILPNFEFEHKQGLEFVKQEKAVAQFLEAMKEPKIAQYKIKESLW